MSNAHSNIMLTASHIKCTDAMDKGYRGVTPTPNPSEVAAIEVTSLLQNDNRPHEEHGICSIKVKSCCSAKTFCFEPGMLSLSNKVNKQMVNGRNTSS